MREGIENDANRTEGQQRGAAHQTCVKKEERKKERKKKRERKIERKNIALKCVNLRVVKRMVWKFVKIGSKIFYL